MNKIWHQVSCCKLWNHRSISRRRRRKLIRINRKFEWNICKYEKKKEPALKYYFHPRSLYSYIYFIHVMPTYYWNTYNDHHRQNPIQNSTYKIILGQNHTTLFGFQRWSTVGAISQRCAGHLNHYCSWKLDLCWRYAAATISFEVLSGAPGKYSYTWDPLFQSRIPKQLENTNRKYRFHLKRDLWFVFICEHLILLGTI